MVSSAKDFSLKRVLGNYKLSEDKITLIECEALARQKDPGPMHKYELNHEVIRPRTQFFAKYPMKDEKL